MKEASMETLEHFPVSVVEEGGVFTIQQQVGSTADDVVTICITADQAKQVGKFLIRVREPVEESPDAAVGFDQFWSQYPRKDAKARALEVWKRHNLGSKREVILAHLAAIKQTPQWTDQGGRFVPHAGTYLSQKRYLDEVETEDFSSFK
jgi:hypothetical protein